MEFAGDVTRQDIKEALESILASSGKGNFYPRADRLGWQVNVVVDNDFTPHIDIDTGRPDFRVRVSTHNLMEEDEVIGWEFNPQIVNASLNQNFDDEDPIGTFADWAEGAELAELIYTIQFRPYDYFD